MGALAGLVDDGDGVLLLGLDDLPRAAFGILADAGLELLRVTETPEAVALIDGGRAQVVLADARQGPVLIEAARALPEMADVHVVVLVDLESPDELRAALDAGADDVMRVPFEPEVLALRVATGLRAARLRANESLLRSLVDNIPGAIYRCACDRDWTMEWLSDEIEEIVGYPASDFIDNAVRTFASLEHPDDREGSTTRSWRRSTRAGRSRSSTGSCTATASVRWVLERGHAQGRATAGGGSTA